MPSPQALQVFFEVSALAESINPIRRAVAHVYRTFFAPPPVLAITRYLPLILKKLFTSQEALYLSGSFAKTNPNYKATMSMTSISIRKAPQNAQP